MNRALVISIVFLLLCSVFPAAAKPAPAPRGWDDVTRGDLRIVNKGDNATIVIYPWEDLGGQSIHDWIELMELELPAGSEIINVDGPVKEKKVPGSYTITYKIDHGSSKGFTAFYGCPGTGGSGKLMRFDMTKTKLFDLIAGASFGERACEAERVAQRRDHLANGYDRSPTVRTVTADSSGKPNVESEQTQQQSTAVPAATHYDVGALAKANATIPASNRPIGASSRLTRSLRGFPAQFVYKMELILDFPNGYSVNCSNWDPGGSFPTQAELHEIGKKCELTRGVEESKKVNGFAPGDTIDAKFGNISSVGYELAEGSGSGFSGARLHMTRAGRIALSKYSAFHVISSGNGAGGGKRSPVLKGHYYLNGHTVTILTDDGDIVHGYIAATSNADSSKIDHIYINGVHYWDRDKKK